MTIQNNLLICLMEEERANFGKPNFIIYNVGQFPTNHFSKGMSSATSTSDLFMFLVWSLDSPILPLF